MEEYELKVTSDIPCEVFIDYQKVAVIQKDKMTRFFLRKGEYNIQMVSTINPLVKKEDFIFIEYNKYYVANFKELIRSTPDLVRDEDLRMVNVEEGWRSYRYMNVLTGDFLPGSFTENGDKSGLEHLDGSFAIDKGFVNGCAVVHDWEKGIYIIKRNGDILVEDIDDTLGFSEGLAAIYKDNKWGFIDNTGEYVIPASFDCARIFQGGLAAVRKNGKWGYINKSGDLVIDCIYDDVMNFYDGVAIARRGSQYGLINLYGSTILPFDYDIIYEGRWSGLNGIFRVKKQDKWGAATKWGEMIYPCEYDYLNICRQNPSMACACVLEIPYGGNRSVYRIGDMNWFQVNKTHYLLDGSNKKVLPSFYGLWEYGFLSENVLTVSYLSSRGHDYKLISLELRFRDTLALNMVSEERNGLIRANTYHNPDTDEERDRPIYGFFDSKGNRRIEFKYDEAFDFDEHIAAVCKGRTEAYLGGKWGYINEKDEEVIPFIFDSAGPFYNGVARVKIGSKYFFIDRYGNELTLIRS